MMKKILALLAAALGVLAFWRKDTLKDDLAKAGDGVKSLRAKTGSQEADAVDDAIELSDDVDDATDAIDAVGGTVEDEPVEA